MTFDEAVEALSALEGERVDAMVWGIAADHRNVANLSGELHRVDVPDDDLPPEVARATLLTAVIFSVGAVPENHIVLWHDRFIRAARLGLSEGIEIVTEDAVLRVAKREPWIN